MKKIINNKNVIGKIIVIAAVIAVIAYFAVHTVQIVKLNRERSALEKKNESLRKLKENLELELGNAETDTYIENLARRDLKLIKIGETLFVIPEGYWDEDDK